MKDGGRVAYAAQVVRAKTSVGVAGPCVAGLVPADRAAEGARERVGEAYGLAAARP